MLPDSTACQCPRLPDGAGYVSQVTKSSVSLVPTVTDVIGLYLDPPQNAVVLCVDEESHIQALDRAAPMLPMQPGLPERRTHDYKRHGTPRCWPRWRSPPGRSPARASQRHRHTEPGSAEQVS